MKLYVIFVSAVLVSNLTVNCMEERAPVFTSRTVKACTRFELRFPLRSRDYVWRLVNQQPESDIVLQNEEYRTTNGGETAFVFMALRESQTVLTFAKKPLTEDTVINTKSYAIAVTKNPLCPSPH
jgi:hypothetical protein